MYCLLYHRFYLVSFFVSSPFSPLFCVCAPSSLHSPSRSSLSLPLSLPLSLSLSHSLSLSRSLIFSLLFSLIFSLFLPLFFSLSPLRSLSLYVCVCVCVCVCCIKCLCVCERGGLSPCEKQNRGNGTQN